MGETLVTICARAGSKGLQGKNTKLLHGKPLLIWTLEQAQAWNRLNPDKEPRWDADYSKPNGDIVISTDSEAVVDLIEGMPIDIIDRPTKLAQDDTPKVDVIRHALEIMSLRKQKQYKIIIDLDVTNPMRTPEMIREAVWEFEETDANVLVSAVKARKNPFFNQIQENYGFYKLISGHTTNFASRQDAPQVYDLNASITIFSHQFFELFEYAKTPTVTPQLAMYEMPGWAFCDVDSELDFKILEYLMCLDLPSGNTLKS